jgi:hypothetical protein
MAEGATPEVGSAVGSGGGALDGAVSARHASSGEGASMLRMCRARGSSARTEMRGSAASAIGGRPRFVAARRTSRRRPSGKATATKEGPRLQVSDSRRSGRPNRG